MFFSSLVGKGPLVLTASGVSVFPTLIRAFKPYCQSFRIELFSRVSWSELPGLVGSKDNFKAQGLQSFLTLMPSCIKSFLI
jgi:hypothetical protein